MKNILFPLNREDSLNKTDRKKDFNLNSKQSLKKSSPQPRKKSRKIIIPEDKKVYTRERAEESINETKSRIEMKYNTNIEIKKIE